MRRSLSLRIIGVSILISFSSLGVSRFSSAQEASFDELVELNADQIFGGKLTRKKDRFTLDFPAEGQFERGFDCSGRGRGSIISNLKDLKRQDVKKVLVDGHKKGTPSFVAVGSASAVSRFELADDFKISFRMRAPTVDRKAQMNWFINRQGRREMIQSSFFQSLSSGSKAKARTKNKRFSAAPSTWFDRGAEGVPVEIVFKNKKATVRVGHYEGDKREEKIEEVVSLEVDGPTSGAIGFQFDKLSFLMMNFRIEGKFPTEWAEKEIERLRKAKKLRTKSVAEVAKKGGGKAAAGGKKDGQASTAPRRRGRGSPDLDKPDPEADDDL